jgi:hypothetical protein
MGLQQTIKVLFFESQEDWVWMTSSLDQPQTWDEKREFGLHRVVNAFNRNLGFHARYFIA